MKRLLFVLTLLVFSTITIFAQRNYPYTTVPNDPMNTRIYTLDNGLTVYLSVYKDAPRIQCIIPVRVGSKNDPKETTGLAHYLEHLMFKGTPNFGTKDWNSEKVLLDQIEELFEVYRKETDQAKRTALYHQIDSISYEASKLAIPNEYDKIMSFIGSQGTNAATSNDYTFYIEDIPSNQLENWAKIQADRFIHPVFRIFHTELETVYEEKNMSLTNDGRLANDMMLSLLFPNHPYGQQTTLGEAEHLKNPSIKNINNFYYTYYVPNNMAICLAGDFNPDNAIAIIDNYFGGMVRKPIPAWNITPETPITQPIEKDIVGLDAEFVRIAFRINQPANSKEIYILNMLDNIMSNGKAGLIDLNLKQKQAVQNASSYPYVLCDNSAFILYGSPKAGQTLEDVKKLLLDQIELIKKGEFNDDLIEAAINNIKKSEMVQLESNKSRAMMMMHAFTNHIAWEDAVNETEAYSKITKTDIIDFANKYLNNNYIVVNKRQGTPADIEKVSKPAITPIVINRDAESDFFKSIKASKVTPIEPVFVDYNKAITTTKIAKAGKKDNQKDINLLSVKNVENETFVLTMRFNIGEMNDLRLPIASRYFNYVNTPLFTSEQIKQEFYKLACNYSISISDYYCQISINGLNDNFKAAVELTMHILNDAQVDTTALHNLVNAQLKNRHDAKSNQQAAFNALRNYCEYGAENVKYILSEDQLKALTGDELIGVIQKLLQSEATFYYYGPSTPEEVIKMLASKNSYSKKPIYSAPKELAQWPEAKKFERIPVNENRVFFAPYNAKQARVATTFRGVKFDPTISTITNMYNAYFGGGMNSIVFQEMREKRSLAYTAASAYIQPQRANEYMYNYAFIATQNDKVIDALDAFNELFNDMPTSENALNLAKESAKSTIEATRITKNNILNQYIKCQNLGYNYDYRQDYYKDLQSFTMDNVVNFNHTYIKDKPKYYLILSKEEDMNFDLLEQKYGKVTKLTLEDIFGF